MENGGFNFFKNTHTEVLLGFLGYITEKYKTLVFSAVLSMKASGRILFLSIKNEFNFQFKNLKSCVSPFLSKQEKRI